MAAPPAYSSVNLNEGGNAPAYPQLNPSAPVQNQASVASNPNIKYVDQNGTPNSYYLFYLYLS